MYKGTTNFSPHKITDNTNKNQICSTLMYKLLLGT